MSTTGLFSKAVCLLVEFRRLGVRRKVATGAVDIGEADPSMIHVSKEILQSKTLEAIRTFDSELRSYLTNRCTPSAMFRGGIFLLPNALIPQVDERLAGAVAARAMLVAAFMAEYEGLKIEAASRLGPHFDATQYPNEDRVRAAFGFRWQYFVVDTPGTLAEIRADLFSREANKAAATWTAALEECTSVLRASFADLVDHMVERLIPAADGKPKVFRNSLVVGFKDFLTTFDARNISGDAELGVLVQRASHLLSGIDPDGLRASLTTRAHIGAQMTAIKASLDTMMIERPVGRYGADDAE